MQVPDVNNPYAYSATTPVYDGTQAVGDLMNDFWLFFNKLESGGPVDDSQMKAFLQNVNDFMAYINAHGTPSSTTDPETYEVWNAIKNMAIGPDTASGRTNWTLAQYAADFASNPATVSFRDLESGIGLTSLMTFVVNPELKSLAWFQGHANPQIQQYDPSNPTSGETQFLQDMAALYNDVADFNRSPSQGRAADVLADLQTLEADMKNLPGGKITDGYLKTFYDFLSANGLTSSSLTAAQLYADLKSVGGASGSITMGQDLQNFINQSGMEEYGSRIWNGAIG